MDSYGDSSTSDLDEELPVYDFLLQPNRSNQAPLSRIAKPNVVVLDSSDTEIPVSSSPVSDRGGNAVWENLSAGVKEPDVKMISSDEEDAPYVPLAQRLKQKQEAVSSSSLFINRQNGHSPRNPSPPEFSAQSAFSESEPLPLYDPEEGSMPQLWPPPKPSSWAGSTYTSPAKKRPSKRTPAEIQTSREEALRRREAREKPEGETRKETRKQEQEREKEERKALAQAAKALRPEECIKHIVACVDPALLQLEGGATLLASLQALGCSCAIEKQPLPRCVSWTRKSPCAQPGPQAGVPEPLVVLQIPVEQFITLVHSYSQEQRGACANGCPSLTTWILDLMDRNPGRSLSLVVIDLETYFKSQKSQGQKKLREAVLGEELGQGAVKKKRATKKKDGGGGGLPDVSRVDVEEALVHLQLHTRMQVRFLHTWADFSQHVVMTTRAVAEAPFKRAREQTGFSFCVESEGAGGRKGARGAGGLQQVWTKQIQQLNRVSPDMASAIVAAYPSPLLLRQAYRKCRSEREGLSLLSDLVIRRGEGVTATTRRIGPELSRRLFLLMTSSDPQQILDSTV